MVKLENLSKEYDKTLFKDVNLTIYDGEKVGVIGENGSGKTTLIRIIAGDELPDKGNVIINSHKLGYLKQITEYTFSDFMGIMSDITEAKSFLKYKSLLKIRDFDFDELPKLSGGEKTKLMLAKILSLEPDILLLDEPTNHLDRNGVDLLIETLNNYQKAVIVVSHDRYFLDRVVTKIIELENGSLNEYYGNYSDYRQQKDKERSDKMKLYMQQKAEEKKINEQLKVLNNWVQQADSNIHKQGGMPSESKLMSVVGSAKVSAGKLAKQAKAKRTRLEQQKGTQIEKPYEEGEVHYWLKAEEIGSKVLIRAENLSKSFNSHKLFENANFEILSGEKIALNGENGSGKTTLIKMILGEEDFKGNIYKAKSLRIGYLSQDVLDLDENLTIMEIARRNGDKNYTTLFLSNLVNMNLNRRVFNRKIGSLSLGERMRIKMCELILSGFNLLILDEPTNHLDLPNRIFLEKILKNYCGAMILVSHDRQLTKNVCSYQLEIKNKTIKKL